MRSADDGNPNCGKTNIERLTEEKPAPSTPGRPEKRRGVLKFLHCVVSHFQVQKPVTHHRLHKKITFLFSDCRSSVTLKVLKSRVQLALEKWNRTAAWKLTTNYQKNKDVCPFVLP